MTNIPTIEQMNEAIAMFEGWQFIKGDANHKCNFCFAGDEPCTPARDRFVRDKEMKFRYDLKYHSSWNCLMSAVKNISALSPDDVIHIEIGKTFSRCYYWGLDTGRVSVFDESADTPIQTVYNADYKFIQWFNNQSNTTNDTTAGN